MMPDLPPIAVLAGGLGTRLGSLTAQIPKSMVIVAGEPFIAHQLRLFRRHGLHRVVICAGHLSQKLVDFVRDGRAFDLDVTWSFDGIEPRGTGGAIAAALPMLDDRFFVTYGDSWLDVDYRAVAAEFDAWAYSALMTVYRNEGRWGTSNVAFSDGCLRRYDKASADPAMRHIEFGLSVLDRSVFAAHDRAVFDLADLYADLVAHGRMAGLEMAERFYEIGSAAGLAETDRLLGAI